MNSLIEYFQTFPVSTFPENEINSFSADLAPTDFIYHALKKIIDTNDINIRISWTPGSYGPSSMSRIDRCLDIIIRNNPSETLLTLLFDCGASFPNIINGTSDETLKILLKLGKIPQDQLTQFINIYPHNCNGLVDYVEDLNQIYKVFLNACDTGNTDLVKKFIQAKVDLNLESFGRTPLMSAITISGRDYDQSECEDDIARLLIEAGADPEFKNKNGENIYDINSRSKYIMSLQKKQYDSQKMTDIVELAKQIGFEITCQDNYDSAYQQFKDHLSLIPELGIKYHESKLNFDRIKIEM